MIRIYSLSLALIFSLAMVLPMARPMITPAQASSSNPPQSMVRASLRIVAMGDAPYFEPGGRSMFEKLIAQTNALSPDFVVHVGDIKSGSTPCTDTEITSVFDLFARFEGPLFYTPGDNEWTDCHRQAAGGFDPIERLSFVRKTFFTSATSMGKQTQTLTRQADVDQAFLELVENSIWRLGGVTFATVHVVGSNNNRDETKPEALAEYTKRNNGNLSWVRQIFERARTANDAAVVLFFQADLLFYEAPEKRTGFNDLLAALETESLAFKKPVLLVHGDSHSFIVDKPLTTALTKFGPNFRHAIENVTRLQVFGAPDVRGVMIHIDTLKAQPFAIEPLPNIDWEY